MAKGNPLLIEPDHDPNDALMVCVLYLKDQKMTFQIKIPGLEGNLNKSRQNEQEISKMVIDLLKQKFGPRVEKA